MNSADREHPPRWTDESLPLDTRRRLMVEELRRVAPGRLRRTEFAGEGRASPPKESADAGDAVRKK
ncbi:MAG TPA: hypothetical protein VGD76_04515 [Ramlibacter sp.]